MYSPQYPELTLVRNSIAVISSPKDTKSWLEMSANSAVVDQFNSAGIVYQHLKVAF